MKNTQFLLIFLFLSFSAAFAQTGKYYQHTYAGSIGGKYPIIMWLQFEGGGKVTGVYSYKSVGESLSLNGKKQGTSINLTEKDKANKQTGTFSLNVSGETLTGKWSSADGSKNFDLTLNRIGKETVNMEKLHYEGKSEKKVEEEDISCSFNVDVIRFSPEKDPSILANYTLEKLEKAHGGSGQNSSNWSTGNIDCGDVNSEATATVTAIQVGDLMGIEISTWEMAGGAHGYANATSILMDLSSGLEVNTLEGNFKEEKIAELCKLLDKKLMEEMKKSLEEDCLISDEGSGVVYKDLQNGVASSAKDWESTLSISPTGISFSREFEVSYAAQVCGGVTFFLSFKELAPYISDSGVFADFK